MRINFRSKLPSSGANEWKNVGQESIPLLRGGDAAPFKLMSRYLKQGAAGEVRMLVQQWFDLPGRAEFKVTLHFA